MFILIGAAPQVYDYSTNDYGRQTKAMPSKMKTKYWVGKQQLRQKMGKEEDAWVVKGDRWVVVTPKWAAFGN